MDHETAFDKPASLGQFKEIVATLVQAIPPRLSFDEAQHIIEDKGWLIGEVQKLFAWRSVQEQFDIDVQLSKARADMMVTDNARGTAFQIEEWVQFYRGVFDLDVHYSQIKIPPRRSEFYRLIVVAQGLTLKRIIEVARKDFPVEVKDSWRYFSRNEETRGTHDRLPTQTYAVWVRDRIDPDEEHNGVRPAVLERRGVQCSTLLEHLLFHLKYFRETGNYLDRNERHTMCCGSRDGEGSVTEVSVYKSRRDGKSLGIYLGTTMGRWSAREVIV